MRENTVKSIWARGGVVVNGWLSIPSSFSAEVMAHQGFDSLVVDMQHGVVDYQTAVTMLQAISTTGVIPFARVPWNDPAYIMKILDAGAYGIICPMINTRKEAEQLVRTCKYVPKGYRSFGPVRASIYGGTDYATAANDTLVVMPMIETKEAVQNIDEILSTPGIDAVYVGPADLSLTLGCTPKLDQTEPPVVEALGKILAACKRHKVIAGLHNATSGYALKMAAQLLDAMATDWKPTRYHDTYAEELRSRIDARDKGEEIVEEEPAEPSSGKVVDLMAALEESVAKAKRGGSRGRSTRSTRSKAKKSA